MSWTTDVFTYPGNYTRNMLMKEVADCIKYNGDCGSSYVQVISDKVFGCEDDAVDFLYDLEENYDYSKENLCEEDKKIIDEVAKNSYRDTAVAVKYLSISNIADPYIASSFVNFVSDTIKEHTKYVEDGLAELFEQSYVKCSHCNSSLNTEYLETEKCPLCEQDIISNEAIKRITLCENRINTEAQRVFGKNTKVEIKLAVAFRYHY